MSRIQVTTLGRVSPGEFIAHVDDDELTDEHVNEWYDADEQEWAHVIARGGHDDVGWIKVRFDDGREERVSVDWSGVVWRLAAGGEAVREDLP